MLFNSPVFLLLFLPAFLMIYFALPGIRLRNLVIVLFSAFFFAWGDPVFIWYVIGGTLIDYVIIKYVLTVPERSESIKKIWLFTAVMINVLSLLFFKYANFFIDQIEPLLSQAGIQKPSWYGVALPLGISFIAFHKISFVTDLYKHRTAPPKTFIDALLYIIFFPQLIAGPIIRYHEIGEQIRLRSHNCEEFIAGFLRFSRGLAKKSLLADPSGRIANVIFAISPDSIPVNYVWVGVISYAIQIYYDFSGYSDMAIGLGQIVGFRFPENFNQPYTAISITDFWRRWHITLSNWMRLYLYIPLGGNHVAPWRMYINLWIVFLISGLWHGAAWTFVLWGAYFGFFLTVEKFFERQGWELSLPRIVKQLSTLIIVLNSWVLFRSPTLGYAKNMFGRMYGILPQTHPTQEPFSLIFPPYESIVIIIGVFIAMISLPDSLRKLATIRNSFILDVFRLATGIILFFVSLSCILASGSSSFLYFRF